MAECQANVHIMHMKRGGRSPRPNCLDLNMSQHNVLDC